MFEFDISISILGILTMQDPTKGEAGTETGWGIGVETGGGTGVEALTDYLSSV